jgi:predicted amidohydrolase
MSFAAGIVQMRSGLDMARNFREASALISEAAARGASLVSTPEATNIFDSDKERLRSLVKPEAEDLSVGGFSALAAKLRIHLHVGSLALKGSDGRIVNRSLLFAPDGGVAARYDKIHLFDVDLPSGETYRESATYAPGDTAVVVDLPQAAAGLSICYDMRFPQLYQSLARGGADLLLVPAAFTVPTGKAHWHVLLRARAIETGSFVLAAAQGGQHETGLATFGHSLAINPWGEILAEAEGDPGVLVVTVDRQESVAARQRIPALRNARPFTLKPAPGVAT